MLRNKKTYFTRPPAQLGQDILIHTEESDETRDLFEEVIAESSVVCASCNRTIHDNKELGGYCFRCSRNVCVECAKLRCAVHRKVICEDDAYHRGEKVICKSDSIFDFLKLVLSKEDK